MTQQTTTEPGAATDVELAIGGMTCASCAARIEKKLNKLDGVTATVNYATEKAKVTYPTTLTPGDLVTVVEATGYTATVPTRDAQRRGKPRPTPSPTTATPKPQAGGSASSSQPC